MATPKVPTFKLRADHAGRVAMRKLVRQHVPDCKDLRKHVRQVVDNGGNLMTQLTCAHGAKATKAAPTKAKAPAKRTTRKAAPKATTTKRTTKAA